MSQKVASRTVTVPKSAVHGLHARPCMQIIEVVNRHVPAPCSECFITNTTNENKKANGTSIMQVVCLGSLPGHELLVEVHAFDEETATTACKEIAYYISCINESGD